MLCLTAQGSLSHPELLVAVEMLSSVVLINEALNVGDRAAVWKQLSSTLTGLSNVEDEYAQRWEYGTAQSEMDGWNMQSKSVLFTLRHIHDLILHALSVHVILKKKILTFHQITIAYSASEMTFSWKSLAAWAIGLSTISQIAIWSLFYLTLIQDWLYSCIHRPLFMTKYVKSGLVLLYFLFLLRNMPKYGSKIGCKCQCWFISQF